MKTSSTGRALIESFEGLFTKTYDDANDKIVKAGDPIKGVLTIGYGHTSAAGPPKVTVGQVITKVQADAILASDLAKVEADVSRLVKVPLNQNQFDALVSFQFNTGALGKASLLKKLNAKDYTGAANGLLAWVNAKQIGPGPVAGLVRRRQQERALFLKPTIASPTHVGAGAAGAIVTGAGAAAAVHSGHHWVVITIGVVVLVGLAWYTIHHYLNKGTL